MRAIITGAAMGIGQAVARALAVPDACLILVDHAADALTAAADELKQTGARVETVAGSVADPDTAAEACRRAVELFGGIDLLSHNAGIQRYGTAETTDPSGWHAVLDVNLTGAFLIARAALPALRAARGSIVFMGSVQGLVGSRNSVAYVAAKHGLHGLAKAMALDLAPDGVRVNVVAPGSVDTPMLRWAIGLADDPSALTRDIAAMHPLGRPASAAEVAAVVLFLASEKASFITGEILRVDGGLLTGVSGTPSSSASGGAVPTESVQAVRDDNQ